MEKGAFVNRALSFAGPLIAVLALAACNAGGSSSTPGSTGQSVSQSRHIPQWQLNHTAVAACPGVRVGGQMQCDALIESSHGMNRAMLTGRRRLGAARFPDALQPPVEQQGSRAHRCDRRRIRQPQRRLGPRGLSHPVRSRNGELQEVQPSRATEQLPAG